MTPELLLGLHVRAGLRGRGASCRPTRPFVSDLLPRTELGQGAALSSLGVNLARAVGPADRRSAGGAARACRGCSRSTRISFLVFAAALLTTPRPPPSAAPLVRAASWSSLGAGVHYVEHSPAVRRILLRLVLFAVPANVLWALLAPLAEGRLGLGATGYGILLGAAGAGAVAGAVLLPAVRTRVSPSRLLTLAGAVFGLGLVGLAAASTPVVAVLVLVPVGDGVDRRHRRPQRHHPGLPARLGPGAGAGRLPDGAVRHRSPAAPPPGARSANQPRPGPTFLLAGALLLVTTVVGIWLPLRRTDLGDRTAVAGRGPARTSRCSASDVADDPVEIVLQLPRRPRATRTSLPAGDGRRADQPAAHRCRRRGSCCGTPCDTEQLVERFAMASWADHRDQHERRLTPFDAEVVKRAAALAQDGAPDHAPARPGPAPPGPSPRTGGAAVRRGQPVTAGPAGGRPPRAAVWS